MISAQKRGVAEDAQTVPLALTVITNVDIEERHVRDLQDLRTASPNVTLTDLGTVKGFASFTIRGLGVNTTIPSMEPAVGVFVDGIYLGMSAGAVLDVIDIEDIEILRGPQGLLFGRNTTGGAVLINTRRPGDVFAVNGRFNYETGPQETASVSIEGPIGRAVSRQTDRLLQQRRRLVHQPIRWAKLWSLADICCPSDCDVDAERGVRFDADLRARVGARRWRGGPEPGLSARLRHQPQPSGLQSPRLGKRDA